MQFLIIVRIIIRVVIVMCIRIVIIIGTAIVNIIVITHCNYSTRFSITRVYLDLPSLKWNLVPTPPPTATDLVPIPITITKNAGTRNTKTCHTLGTKPKAKGHAHKFHARTRTPS